MKKQRGGRSWQILTGAVFLASAFCATASLCSAQETAKTPPAAQTTLTEQRDVVGKQQWMDTAIDLYPGDVVKFHATGSLQRPGAPACGPDGRVRDWHDVNARYPVNQAGVGELVGRIGVGDKTRAFGVGSHHETKVQIAGRLYLGVNEASNEMAAGGYHVSIEIVHAAPAPIAGTLVATAAGAVIEVPAAAFPTAGLEQIPLRVSNKQGAPGDMVNFVLVGSGAAVDQAFKDAGWLKVLDTNKEHRRAAVGGVFSGFRHKPFVEMPMSQLYLFGRPQDVGYARGTAVAALGSRHHLRLWKAPMQVDGQDVWVGAATHDKSFMHDPHHRGFSHFIDPNVDDERTYIQQTLASTHEATQWTMVQPANAIQTAYTVSGQAFHSNGQLLVLWLHAPNQNSPVIAAQATGSAAPVGVLPAVTGANAFTKN
ncbi:MAG: LssY C-terminal domain-containing protein [Candidatus Acidiferrales bacterium]